MASCSSSRTVSTASPAPSRSSPLSATPHVSSLFPRSFLFWEFAQPCSCSSGCLRTCVLVETNLVCLLPFPTPFTPVATYHFHYRTSGQLVVQVSVRSPLVFCFLRTFTPAVSRGPPGCGPFLRPRWLLSAQQCYSAHPRFVIDHHLTRQHNCRPTPSVDSIIGTFPNRSNPQ